MKVYFTCIALGLCYQTAVAQILTEILVNPNGGDSNCEYVEIYAPPGSTMTDLFFVSIEGDFTSSAGAFDQVVDLTSQTFGSNGIAVITNDASGDCTRNYNTPLTHRTTVTGFSMENGSNSWALIKSPTTPLVQGTDHDSDNNGVLDGLPGDASIVDSLGWTDGGVGDLVYGTELPPLAFGAHDMASRFPGDLTPNSASAWFYGDMDGANTSLIYDAAQISANFPPGGKLNPGEYAPSQNLNLANAIHVETLPYSHTGVNPLSGDQEEGSTGCNFNVPSLDYKFRVTKSGTVTVALSAPAGAPEPMFYRAATINETDPVSLTVYDNVSGDGASCFTNDSGVDGTRTASVQAGDIFYVLVSNGGITDITFSGDAELKNDDLCVVIKDTNNTVSLICL